MKYLIAMMAFAGLCAGSSRAEEVKIPLTGENTKITFVGTKTDGKHEGGFKVVTGSATMDGSDLTSLKLSVDIDMDSCFTDDEKLTGHLKSPDFFEVKTHPKAKFVSTKIAKGDDGYTVSGKLTMCGKTKEISFPAKIEAKANSITLTSDFKIDRNDWGIKYGKGKINDEVALKIALNAKK